MAKLNSTGSALLYSTFLGGSGHDFAHYIVADDMGNIYAAGETSSTDFPTTPGAFQTTFGGGARWGDAFVTKLNATGSALIYSTFLGGTDDDEGMGIAVDSSGNAYIAGSTKATDFPITANAIQKSYLGNRDAYVTKLNASGSALLYSSYLGGVSADFAAGIVVDRGNKAYIAGGAASTDFPIMPGAYQKSHTGGLDSFVTKVDFVGPVCPMMTLSPATLSAATFGTTYSDQLMTVTGAIKPMTFSVTKGALPPWMMLSTTGFLSGSLVNSLGTYSFTITAKDDSGCEVSQDYTITSSLIASAEVCLQDDVDPGKSVAVDFATGKYSVKAGAVRLTGSGKVNVTSDRLELTDNTGGNSVTISVSRLDAKANAVVYLSGPPLRSVLVRDGNVLDSACAARP